MTCMFFGTAGQALKIRDCPEKFGMDGHLSFEVTGIITLKN